jgi:antitoxin PrlF
MGNAAMQALKTAQDSFAREAERVGLKNEQDVVLMIKEIRYGTEGENHADDDSR